MASAPPDGTAKGRSNGKRRKMPEIRRGIPENTGNTQKNTGEQGKNIREIRMPEYRNAGEGGREMPGNRLKSNQPQSILRLIFHISRDKGTRSGNSLSYPVRRIAATVGTIKKSGRPRLFGLPQAGVLLEKWELLLPKNFGDVRLLPWGMFPGSRRCCEAAPDSAGKMS